MNCMRMLAVCALIVQIRAVGQPAADDFEAIVRRHVDAGTFQGSILVASDGEVVLSGSYGDANLEWANANTPHTKFRIASLSKAFAAAAVLKLAESGKLRLDASISHYLPEYRADTGSRITLHHLSSHTSGLPDFLDRGDYWSTASKRRYKWPDFIREYCSGDLKFEPGSKFEYSNSGYAILGLIVETITGQSYDDALRTLVLEPAGLHDTGFDDHRKILAHRATGYDRSARGHRTADYVDMTTACAGGGLYSTVLDLHRWDRALAGTTVLSAQSIKLMFRPNLDDYAYGWFVRQQALRAAPKVVHSHGGSINGFTSAIIRVPADGVCIVALSNLSRASTTKLANDLLAAIYP